MHRKGDIGFFIVGRYYNVVVIFPMSKIISLHVHLFRMKMCHTFLNVDHTTRSKKDIFPRIFLKRKICQNVISGKIIAKLESATLKW